MNRKHPNETESMDWQNRIITVPNMLSLFRICLIPLFMWMYGNSTNSVMAGCVLILSGLTDVVDGAIARRFHMITNLGKVLDPIADKTTQAAVLFCLLPDYPHMLFPFVLLIIKEMSDGITGFLVIRKTGQVLGAGWHGKVGTILIYFMMIVHVIWREMPGDVSGWFAGACSGMTIVSLVLYGRRNLKLLGGGTCK